MPVKTGRPAIFRITVTYFNPQKCCPHFYLPFFYNHRTLGTLPDPPPWKIFFIRACYALYIIAGRNYDKRTNRRTFDPINRCPRRTFQAKFKQWDRRYIAFVADTALSNNLTLNSGKTEQRILDHDNIAQNNYCWQKSTKWHCMHKALWSCGLDHDLCFNYTL